MTKKQKLSVLCVFFIGVLIFGTSVILKKQVKIAPPEAGQLSLEQVNSIDAAMAHGYNKNLDDLATLLVALGNFFTCVVCFLVPGILALKKKTKLTTVFFDFFIFIEVWIYTRGIYSILKNLAQRYRPYMYFQEQDTKGISEGDFFKSWPSGHSASVFLAAGFLVSWVIFNKLSPALKKLTSIIVILISAETAVLRVLSGNHFFTDVISGTIIGITVSVILFKINKDLTKTAISE